MSINLSPHEKKILSLVDKYPSIIDDPLERKRIAELNGMSEKTLRNRPVSYTHLRAHET